MLLAWRALNGMAGEFHNDDLADDLARLRTRELTLGKWFLRACDGKLTDEDVNDEGNAFAAAYYDLAQGRYLADYEHTLGRASKRRPQQSKPHRSMTQNPC